MNHQNDQEVECLHATALSLVAFCEEQGHLMRQHHDNEPIKSWYLKEANDFSIFLFTKDELDCCGPKRLCVSFTYEPMCTIGGSGGMHHDFVMYPKQDHFVVDPGSLNILGSPSEDDDPKVFSLVKEIVADNELWKPILEAQQRKSIPTLSVDKIKELIVWYFNQRVGFKDKKRALRAKTS